MSDVPIPRFPSPTPSQSRDISSPADRVEAAGFVLTPGATALVKLTVIGLGVMVTLLLYAICFWIDNADPLERDSAAFVKK